MIHSPRRLWFQLQVNLDIFRLRLLGLVKKSGDRLVLTEKGKRELRTQAILEFDFPVLDALE